MKHRDDTGLFDYQQIMKSSLYESWAKVRSVMCQMPTGTGKTHLLVSVVRDFVRSEGRPVWIVAHRIELIEQISGTLSHYGVPHGRIVGGSSGNGELVQVASIQTLNSLLQLRVGKWRVESGELRVLADEDSSLIENGELKVESDAVGNDTVNPKRNPLSKNLKVENDMVGDKERTVISEDPEAEAFIRFFGLQKPGLLVIDEAHHSPAKSYRRLWELFPDSYKLGMTATPCRLSRGGFTALFETLLTSWPVSRFIEEGRLALFDYLSIRPESEAQHLVDSLSKRGVDGDYSLKEMGAVMDCPEAIEQLYRSYKAFVEGKKGIIYAINRSHSRHIRDYFQSHGVRIVSIDSRTPSSERREYVEGYARGEIDVLVNVDIFSEGFDCPAVEFIQLARPTLSLSKYLQQVGRGLRVHPDKVRTVILDQVGLYLQFGLPTEARDWQLMFAGRQSGKGMKEVEREAWLERQVESSGPGFSSLQMSVVQGYEEFLRQAANRLAEVEAYEENGLYGLRKGDEVILSPAYLFIDAFVEGYAVISYRGGRYGLITEKGNVLPLPKCQTISLYGGGLAYVEESPVVRYYLDLKTFERYDSLPELFTLEFLEFVYYEEVYYLRMHRRGWKIIPSFTREDMRIEGDLFFHEGIFIHRSAPTDIYWYEYTDKDGCLIGSDRNENLYSCPPGKAPVYYGVKKWMENTRRWNFIKI